MGAQSVFLGQPGLSVPTQLYGQAVFTESVLCQLVSHIFVCDQGQIGFQSLSLSLLLSLSLPLPLPLPLPPPLPPPLSPPPPLSLSLPPSSSPSPSSALPP